MTFTKANAASTIQMTASNPMVLILASNAESWAMICRISIRRQTAIMAVLFSSTLRRASTSWMAWIMTHSTYKATTVEINSSKAKELGVAIANNSEDDNGNPTLGNPGSFALGQSATNTIDGNKIFGWFGSYSDINAQLNALVKKGDAKILSQPYIIAMSGDKAEILIGGEIPVPVNTGDNAISVEWREYGIKLNIEPNVMKDNAVDSKIDTEVSSLDWSSAIAANGSNGSKIPGMRSRKATTHVQMRPGMTMAIGGLISSEDSKSIQKIPLLGDIPILGQFFRTTSKSREKKEIIILLTPILVDSDYKPIMSDEAARLSKLTDKQVLDGEVYEQPKSKKKKKK